MISNNVPTRRKDTFLPLAIHLHTSPKCAEESSVFKGRLIFCPISKRLKNLNV